MCVTFSLQRRRWYFFYLVTMWHFFDFSCTITKIFATSTLYVMYTFMDALLVLHQRSMVLIVAGWAFWWMICQRICSPIAYPPDASFAHVTRCFPSLPTNHNHNYTKLEMQYSIICNICAAYGCVNRRHLHDKCRDDAVLSTYVIAHISVICYESHMGAIPYFDQVENAIRIL